MLSTIDIVMIIIIVVSIAIIVYIKMNKNNDTNTQKSKVDKLLEDSKKALNLKTTDDVSESFYGNIVFNTLEDITQNMSEYLKYASPDTDMNEINSLLKENGLNKTAQTIFDEHKTLDSLKFVDQFNLLKIIDYNVYNSFKYTNEDEIKKYLRLNTIVLQHYVNIYYNKKLNTDEAVRRAMNNITSIEMILNNDFMTNDIFTYYIRTSNNKNIPFSDAIENPSNSDSLCYLPDKLCKISKSTSEFITTNKSNFLKKLDDYNKINKLHFIKYLFDLNNIDNNGNEISSPIAVPPKILDEIKTIETKLYPN